MALSRFGAQFSTPTVGRGIGMYYNHFNGSIDDVRIYDRALSAEEIAQLFRKGEVPALPPVVKKTPDFDGDGSVGFPDFLQFARNFGKSQEDADFDPKFDLNGNGSVGFPDFLLFAQAFGKPLDGSGEGFNTLGDDGDTFSFADPDGDRWVYTRKG